MTIINTCEIYYVISWASWKLPKLLRLPVNTHTIFRIPVNKATCEHIHDK